jgi:hypothetical protein
MQVPVDIDLLKNLQTRNLTNFEFVKLTEEMEQKRKSNAEYMRNYRKSHNGKGINLTENESKNRKSYKSTVLSTEPITSGFVGVCSSQNCEAEQRSKGGRGVIINNVTSNSVTGNDVTLHLKEKNIKKRKEFFENLYQLYPRKKGNVKGVKKLLALDKKGLLPSDENLLACLEIEKQTIFENREIEHIPYFSTWVNSETWKDMPDKITAHIERKKAIEAHKAAQPVQVQSKAAKAAETQDFELEIKKLDNVELPTAEEWEKTDGISRMVKAVELKTTAQAMNEAIQRRNQPC